MSLDVSEILIKFGNLSRLFELFGCVILDSVCGSKFTCSVYISKAILVFLSRAGPSPREAKVALRQSWAWGCMDTPKFSQPSVGGWETYRGHLFHLGGGKCSTNHKWSVSKPLSQVVPVQYKGSCHNIQGLVRWDLLFYHLEILEGWNSHSTTQHYFVSLVWTMGKWIQPHIVNFSSLWFFVQVWWSERALGKCL